MEKCMLNLLYKMRSHYQAFVHAYMERMVHRWIEAALVPPTPAQLERQAIYEEMELRRILFQMRYEPWFSIALDIVTLIVFGWALASQPCGFPVVELGSTPVRQLVYLAVFAIIFGVINFVINWLNDGLYD